MAVTLIVRPAETRDVRQMKDIIDRYAGSVMLGKELSALCEDVPEFLVVEQDATVLACGALRVCGEDLAEIRTVAVRQDTRGRGVGSLLIRRLLDVAAGIGLRRVFVLTFETEFFARQGFHPLLEEPQPVSAGCARLGLPAADGAPLFLDLGQAKSNTLGNQRMMLTM